MTKIFIKNSLNFLVTSSVDFQATRLAATVEKAKAIIYLFVVMFFFLNSV